MNSHDNGANSVIPFSQAQQSERFPHQYFREFIITESKLFIWLRDFLQRVLHVPAILTEVLMRHSFGERYFNIGAIIFFVLMLLFGGMVAQSIGLDSDWFDILSPVLSLHPDSNPTTLFIGLFVCLGGYHYVIIKRRIWQNKSLEHFSLHNGTPHETLWQAIEWGIHAIPMALRYLKAGVIWLIMQVWNYGGLAIAWLHHFLVIWLHKIPYLRQFSFTFTIPPAVVTTLLTMVRTLDQGLDWLLEQLAQLLRRLDFNDYMIKRYAEPILVILIGVIMLVIFGNDYDFIGGLLVIGGSSSFIRTQIEYDKGRRYLLTQNDKRIVGKQLTRALDPKTPAKKMAGVSLPFLPTRDKQERQMMWASLQADRPDYQIPSE